MVGCPPYPHVGVGQVGILVLVLVLVLVPLHLHLVLVLVPLHLHLGLVPLHLHLSRQPSCAWHPCQRAALNTGSASTWTLGRPHAQPSRLRRPQQVLLLELFSLAIQPGFLHVLEQPPHPVGLLVPASLPHI